MTSDPAYEHLAGVQDDDRRSTRARTAAAFAILVGITAFVWSVRLGVSSDNGPGPGLWPAVSSVVIVLAGIGSMVAPGDDDEAFTAGVRRVVLAVASLVVFTVAFGSLGLILPAAALFVFWFRWLGGESWRLVLPLTVVCVAAIYAVFVLALRVPVPDELLVPRGAL